MNKGKCESLNINGQKKQNKKQKKDIHISDSVMFKSSGELKKLNEQFFEENPWNNLSMYMHTP